MCTRRDWKRSKKQMVTGLCTGSSGRSGPSRMAGSQNGEGTCYPSLLREHLANVRETPLPAQHLTAKQSKNPFLFFTLTFALTWFFWVPAAAISRGTSSFPQGILNFLGGFCPTVTGILFVYRTQDEECRQAFWKRVFRFRLIGARWYAFILLVFPVLVTLSVVPEILWGAGTPFFPYLAALAAKPLLLLLLPVIALQVVLIGPLSEELGWRGYALDALQTKWSAFASGLIVGIFWSLWHLPLFFIVDETNFYYEWGFGTALFWLFLLRMTLLSVVITWVYNNNRRSILSAILLHFMYNFTFSFVYPVPESMHFYGTFLLLVLVMGIVLIWGPRTLTRRRALAVRGAA